MYIQIIWGQGFIKLSEKKNLKAFFLYREELKECNPFSLLSWMTSKEVMDRQLQSSGRGGSGGDIGSPI